MEHKPSQDQPFEPRPDIAAMLDERVPVEDELAAQPSPSVAARAQRSGLSRSTVIATLTAAVALAGLVALLTLTRTAGTQLNRSNDTLATLSNAVRQACDTGQVKPTPEGVAACARAEVAAEGGVLDGPRIADTLRSIIAANPPALARDPGAVAARARPLLPELTDDALRRASDAQVAAAQGAARQDDADTVVDGSAPPPPKGTPPRPSTSAPAPTTVPTPVPTSVPATVDPGPEPGDPTDVPTDEPDAPQATEIVFERTADGGCQAVTRYDDGSQSAAPADPRSCGITTDDPPADSTSNPDGSTSNPDSSTSSPDEPATPNSQPESETGAPPLIRIR